MRLNWDTALIGRHVVLVPYREHYVERYHAWMQDEEMLRLTASDKLTLEQEAANCVSWRDDEAKLTFIVLDKALCRCGASTHAEAFPASAMVGDVNVFRDRDDGARGEVEVMIAEAAARGRGCGSEAVRLVMSYARAKMTIKSFFVKIGDGNAASLKLFECLGFAKCNYSEAFKETELELSAARVADAALPLSETTFLAPNSGSAFDVIRFEEQLLDEKFSCAIFLFGEKCAWVWVGKGDDPRMESMCIAAPAAFEHGMVAVTSIVDDAAGIGAPMAQRLSQRSKRLVVVSWSLGEEHGLFAPKLEVAIRNRLPSFGTKRAREASPPPPPPPRGAMDDLFGDDSDAASDDESTLATGPPPPHRGGPYLTPLPPVRPGQVGTPLVEYFPAHAEYLVYLSDAMELREDLADVGGGRGYVAARDVEPGELLMVERAVIERCDVDREHVLEDAAEQLLGMSEIDPDLKASLDRLQCTPAHPAADSIDGEYDGIVRLALAWRFNAFESGLYLHKSLFNDSENAPATQLLVGELSEVWATSAISRGDAVTLHYVYPRDCTAAKREKYLVAHHGFWDGAPAFDSNAADEAFEAALDRVEENYDAVEAEARRAGPAGGGAGLEKQTRALLDDARAQRRAAAPYPMALQRRAHSLVARVADFMSDIGADVSPAPAAAPAAASKVAAEATPAAPDAHDLAVAELPPILARDGEALRCALLWLGALDEYSPDVATAAGIASAAYGRVSRRLPRSTIQRCLRDCPGLDLATAEADLRARAMRSAELFDSRRWLEAQSTARPEQ